jgi:hypothetical protein
VSYVHVESDRVMRTQGAFANVVATQSLMHLNVHIKLIYYGQNDVIVTCVRSAITNRSTVEWSPVISRKSPVGGSSLPLLQWCQQGQGPSWSAGAREVSCVSTGNLDSVFYRSLSRVSRSS